MKQIHFLLIALLLTFGVFAIAPIAQAHCGCEKNMAETGKKPCAMSCQCSGKEAKKPCYKKATPCETTMKTKGASKNHMQSQMIKPNNKGSLHMMSRGPVDTGFNR